MRLALDMRHLTGQMHGMARYAIELAKAMLALEEDLQIEALVLSPQTAGALPAHPRLRLAPCPLSPYGPAAQFKLPGFLRALKPDLYHCPFYAPPRFYDAPMVVTIHDLIHLLFPQDHGARHRWFYRLVVGPAVRRAAGVITVSQQSAKDISRLLGVDPAKITVTPNGVGPAYRPLDPNGRQRARLLGLPESYILGVGNPKPHKNLAALIKAHDLLPGLLPPDQPAPPLVLVGVAASQLSREPGPGLILLDHLDEPDLALAYGAALAVAIPSLYEGFGLPALEAMACGAPVVAARRASLPEVVGKAGVLCGPDPQSLARALADLLAEPEMARALAQAGLERAALFTWQNAASATLAAYDEALRQ